MNNEEILDEKLNYEIQQDLLADDLDFEQE